MIRTVEAMLDDRGVVRLFEPVVIDRLRRVLVTILDEEPMGSPNESAQLSETGLAAD